MHPNESRIREFYAAFARRDAEGMARCYHADIFFSDAVFPRLRGPAAADMWRMLLSRATDLGAAVNAVDNPTISSVVLLGEVLFTRYMFAFEVTSILIIAAMVGAVVLARKREEYSCH